MDRKVATQSHKRNLKGDGYDDKREKKMEQYLNHCLRKVNIIVKEKLTMTAEQYDWRKAEKWRKYRQATVREKDPLLSGERQRGERERTSSINKTV